MAYDQLGKIRFSSYRPASRWRLREDRLTLIAAMVCGEDRLLFGTDSQVTDASGIKTIYPKPQLRPEVPLAWGFSGDESVGGEFNHWMARYPIGAESTWKDVADAASEHLSRLNGRKRERMFLARVEPKPTNLAAVLMAGFVGGKPDIWELSDDGGATSVGHYGFYGVGSGWPIAAMTYLTVKRFKGGKAEHGEFLMYHMLDSAIQHAEMCGHPIRLFSVVPDGLSEIDLNAERPKPEQ